MQRELEISDETGGAFGKAFLFFGAAQFSRSMVWCVTDLLIGYHLVERLGLSGRVAGSILFASFMLGAFLNILIADIIGRLGSPAANALKLQATFGIASLVSCFLLFGPTPPEEPWRIAYVCVAAAAFRITYTVFDVCQNALISLLPRNDIEVRRYVSAKIMVSSLGRLVAATIAFAVLQSRTDVFTDFTLASILAIPIVASLIGLARITPPTTCYSRDDQRFRWRSLPWTRLSVPIVATLFELSFLNIVTRLLPLFGVEDASYASSAALVIAMVCGTIVGPSIAFIGTRLPRHRAAFILVLSLCTASFGIILLYSPGQAASLVLAFGYGATLTAITNLIWERVAFIVTDEAERTGTRIDVPAFALLTASINVAIGFSNGILALVLDSFRSGSPWSLNAISLILMLGGAGTAFILLNGADFQNLFVTWVQAARRTLAVLAIRRAQK